MSLIFLTYQEGSFKRW